MKILNLHFINVETPVVLTINNSQREELHILMAALAECMHNKTVVTLTNSDNRVTHVIDGAQLRAVTS